jgi:hypothetical protein
MNGINEFDKTKEADRQCYEELTREMEESSRSILFVALGREPWHEAVQNALPFGPLFYASQERMREHLDQIVVLVMQQDSSWPEDRVRGYAQYLIETASGIELTQGSAPGAGF